MTGGRLRGVELLLDASLHAHDPAADKALFEGVLQRRIIAFTIDLFIIAVPIGIIGLLTFLFCTFSLKMDWTLLWLLVPLSAVWALLYYGVTMGGPASATVGMQTAGIEVRTWYGARCYPELGAAHGLLFWALVAALTPLVLVVGLFNVRHQLLHDLLLGAVVIRAK
jgi:uncharacterized RDD family membrane protein YckC